MKRRAALFALAAGAFAAVTGRASLAQAALPQVLVFKSPTCGCCGAWVDHMEMGSRRDPYQVLLVARDGHERVFTTYR